MIVEGMIKEMTTEPYEFAVTIEVDREVVTATLYNNWTNKVEESVIEVRGSIDEVVKKLYEKFELRGNNEQK